MTLKPKTQSTRLYSPTNFADQAVESLAVVVRPLVAEAMKLEITEAVHYESAAADLRLIKGKMQEADELRRSLTRPLDEAKKRIMDLFRPLDSQLKAAEAALKGAMLDFQGMERRRLAAEAEEAVTARQAEVDRLARLEEAARAKGKNAKADALAVIAAATPEVEVEEATQVQGISTRVTWRAEVTSLRDLVDHASKQTGNLQYVLPNMEVLNKIARSFHESVTIPGVSFISTEVMASSRG